MKRIEKTLLLLALGCALVFGAALTVRAQDFYGEGNVLIAVDMAPYGVNGEVDYPEGTMGTLVWGEDAPRGESSRPAFALRSAERSADALPPAPDYALETVYEPGQTCFLPFPRGNDDPDYFFECWLLPSHMPAEMFRDGEPRFWISSSSVTDEYGETRYLMPAESTKPQPEDEDLTACVDFLEFECVAVSEHSTLWRYTGTACSVRTGFDPAEYGGPAELTEAQRKLFADTCDMAWEAEAQFAGDPRYEDASGDRDGRAACLFMDFDMMSPNIIGFYMPYYTAANGLDCLCVNSAWLARSDAALMETEGCSTLIHELNHYILGGCVGHELLSSTLAEALAEYAVGELMPGALTGGKIIASTKDMASALRMVPGLLLDGDYEYASSAFSPVTYSLGPHFLRYIERQSTGGDDNGLWRELIGSRMPDRGLTNAAVDDYLRERTGEGLEAWIARFMAAVVAGAEDGPFCMGDAKTTQALSPDHSTFFRDSSEYGTLLGVVNEESAADAEKAEKMNETFGVTAMQGGGTAYAYRSDTGGPIAITGADDRWYFFALDMELPNAMIAEEESGGGTFADVSEDDCYASAVAWAQRRGVTKGTSETTFSPERVCTRAQAITFLWRAFGEPAPAGDRNPFTDVPAGSYYDRATLWALEQGVTAGTSAKALRFSPDRPCTCAEILTFIWRARGSEAPAYPSPLTDGWADAYYYKDAVAWADSRGMLDDAGDTFDPALPCTRGRTVAWLWREAQIHVSEQHPQPEGASL